MKRLARLLKRTGDEVKDVPPPLLTRVMSQPNLMISPLSATVDFLTNKGIGAWMQCCKLYYRHFYPTVPMKIRIYEGPGEALNNHRLVTYIGHVALAEMKSIALQQKLKVTKSLEMKTNGFSKTQYMELFQQTSNIESLIIETLVPMAEITRLYNEGDEKTTLWPKLKHLTLAASDCIDFKYGLDKLYFLHLFESRTPWCNLTSFTWQTESAIDLHQVFFTRATKMEICDI